MLWHLTFNHVVLTEVGIFCLKIPKGVNWRQQTTQWPTERSKCKQLWSTKHDTAHNRLGNTNSAKNRKWTQDMFSKRIYNLLYNLFLFALLYLRFQNIFPSRHCMRINCVNIANIQLPCCKTTVTINQLWVSIHLTFRCTLL
jgi:hypothetical protein